VLLFLAIAACVLSAVAFALIAFANGMSDAPQGSGISLWIPTMGFAVGIALFIAHHLLQNVAVHW